MSSNWQKPIPRLKGLFLFTESSGSRGRIAPIVRWGSSLFDAIYTLSVGIQDLKLRQLYHSFNVFLESHVYESWTLYMPESLASWRK